MTKSIIILFVVLIPCWLYASGNLPYLTPANKNMILVLQASAPEVSIFTYELEKGKELLAEANITAYSLSDFSTLIEVAEAKGRIQQKDLESLTEWKMDPAEWGKQRV